MARDPYDILGIARDATLAEAKAAYRRLAELFHPDRLEGVRDEVRAEAARRMREAADAMRAIRDGLGRPLRAPGQKKPPGPRTTPRRPRPATTRSDPGIPERPGGIKAGKKAAGPSDAVTEATAREYHVVLRAAESRSMHVRWSGRHAAATLAALRHGHRIDGLVHQVEWGCYEVELDGAATKRLLSSVLHDDAWHNDPVEVLHLEAASGGDRSELALADVLDLLDDALRYSVLADVY